VDRRTGEVRDAHLFVTVLGGSSLSFACATWTEQFADWAEAHNAALAFFTDVQVLV
jgi:transposase